MTSTSFFGVLLCTLLVFHAPALSQTAPDGDAETADAIETLDNKQFYKLAEAFRTGSDRPVDPAEAFRLHEILAERGHGPSLFRLGEFYFRGDPVDRDLDRAIALFQGAVDNGYEFAQLRLARALAENGAYRQAIAAFERAIAQEAKGAEALFGRGHLRGEFGPYSDVAYGFEITRKYADAGETGSLVALAEAYRQARGTEEDPVRSFALMRAAAAAGSAYAQRRLGQYYEEGYGTEKDLEAAVDAYDRAIGMGQIYALVKKGEALAEQGRMEEALGFLQQGAEADAFDGKLTLARMHYERALGPLSDRRLGAEMLAALAEGGNVKAGRAVLRYHERRSTRIMSMDLDLVLDHMSRAMENGDGWATEALLRFFRVLDWMVPGALDRARQVYKMYGHQVRTHRVLPERLWVTYDPDAPLRTRREIAAIVAGTEGEDLYNGLVELHRINRNAFTEVVQSILADKGYFRGRVNGRMSRGTIRAILQYCRDKGFYEDCNHGPLVSANARKIARSLADE